MPGWRVKVYDNFHYMDEEEAYWLKDEFPDEASAVARAQEIVKECCVDVAYDLATYLGFGDDPMVVAPEGHPRCSFSARDFARALCADASEGS